MYFSIRENFVLDCFFHRTAAEVALERYILQYFSFSLLVQPVPLQSLHIAFVGLAHLNPILIRADVPFITGLLS